MGNVYLIGFAGVGKSTLGKKLADDLGMEFVDTDVLVEEKVGKAIPQIFEDFGESFFRRKEQEVLREITQSTTQNRIVSTGGGTPIFFDNIQLMSDSGKVVWLDRNLEEIYKILKMNPRKGVNVNSYDDLDELYYSRRSFYEQAELRVDVSQNGLSTFKETLLQWLD